MFRKPHWIGCHLFLSLIWFYALQKVLAFNELMSVQLICWFYEEDALIKRVIYIFFIFYFLFFFPFGGQKYGLWWPYVPCKGYCCAKAVAIICIYLVQLKAGLVLVYSNISFMIKLSFSIMKEVSIVSASSSAAHE